MKSATPSKCEAFTWNTQAIGGLTPEQKARVARLLAIMLHRKLLMELSVRNAA